MGVRERNRYNKTNKQLEGEGESKKEKGTMKVRKTEKGGKLKQTIKKEKKK